MARISASIPEDLKDELYQAATDTGQPISHIIVEALRSHLDSPNLGMSRSGASIDTSALEAEMRKLSSDVQELKEHLTARKPPKGVRFF